MSKFFMVKTDVNVASPISDDDFAKFGKLSVGDTFSCEIWKERNYLLHRKFFKLLSLTLENMPDDFAVRTTVEKPNGETYDHVEHVDSVEKLKWHVLMQAGQYTTHVTLGGKLVYQVKSVSFRNMDETEFQEVYESAKTAIWRFFLPNIKGQDRVNFEQELLNF